MNQALNESVAPSNRLKTKPPIIPPEQAILIRTDDKNADLQLRNPKLPFKDFLLKLNRVLSLIKRPLQNALLPPRDEVNFGPQDRILKNAKGVSASSPRLRPLPSNNLGYSAPSNDPTPKRVAAAFLTPPFRVLRIFGGKNILHFPLFT